MKEVITKNAATGDQVINVMLENGIPTCLGGFLTQTQAAALAVLTANVRKGIEDRCKERGIPMGDEEIVVREFLFTLERLGIDSIQSNDGEVVEHIGHAAKQMNPLLD